MEPEAAVLTATAAMSDRERRHAAVAMLPECGLRLGAEQAIGGAMRLIPILVVCAVGAALPAVAAAVETKDVPSERGAAAPARPAVSTGLSRLAAVTKESKGRSKKAASRAGSNLVLVSN